MSKARRPARENINSAGGNNRSEEDRQEFRPVVEHLIIQGLNDSQIAKITGIDRKAVSHLRKTSARPAEKHPVTGAVVGGESDRVQGEILRLRGMGLSYVEIAEEVGLSWTSVRSRLRNAYRDYMLEQRDAVAGRQVADMEVMRNELLEIIIRSNDDDINADDFMELIAEGDFATALKTITEKARKTQDAKFKAMEILLKLMTEEAKLFSLHQTNVNVNHNIKVEPQAIELLTRLQRREIDNTIEAEVIEDGFEMGNL